MEQTFRNEKEKQAYLKAFIAHHVEELNKARDKKKLLDMLKWFAIQAEKNLPE